MTRRYITKPVWVIIVAIITVCGLPSHAGRIANDSLADEPAIAQPVNQKGQYVNLHPFHTSIGDCHYNPKTKHLEFSIRLFTDDLEQALTTFGKAPFVLDNKRPAEALLTQYLLRHIKVSQQSAQQQGGVASQPINLSVIGKEAANDVTWVYLESADCNPEGLIFRQSALTDHFDDQQNILNVEVGKQKRTLMFDVRHLERGL